MPLASSLRGILTMTAGVGLLTVNDAVTKYLTARYPVGQVVCLRQVAALAFILPYAWAVTGASALRVVNYGGQFLRGMLFLSGAAFVTTSLHLLPLSFVSVMLFSSPLLVALISAPILGERVHAYQWIAVAVGFAGVLLIVQPAGSRVEWIVLLPLAAAFSNAVRDVFTRRLSRTESSMSMLFWSSIVVSIGSAFTAAYGWKAVDLHGTLWFLGAGLSNACAHFLVIEAFRLGNAAVVAPFRYTGLLWAMAIGFVVWHEVPDAPMLVGAAIVIGAGIYMLRETSRRG